MDRRSGSRKRTDLMKRGGIYLVDPEPTAGREQRGHRPVLVVSSESFKRLTQYPVILPVTNGGGFVRRVSFAVPISVSKTSGGYNRHAQLGLSLNCEPENSSSH